MQQQRPFRHLSPLSSSDDILYIYDAIFAVRVLLLNSREALPSIDTESFVHQTSKIPMAADCDWGSLALSITYKAFSSRPFLLLLPGMTPLSSLHRLAAKSRLPHSAANQSIHSENCSQSRY